MSENKQTVRGKFVKLLVVAGRHRFGAGGSIWPFVDREENSVAIGYSRSTGNLYSPNPGNGRLGAARHDPVRPGLSIRTGAAIRLFRDSPGPFSLVGPLSIRGRPLRLAEIFAFSAFGMLHKIAGHTRLGTALCRAGGRHRNVFLLPEDVAGRLLAGGRLRVVLSIDGLFCSLAGFPTGLAVYWLPWIFLAVDKTIRGTHPLAAIGLSVVTFLVLISGQIDVAGQVLLGSGIYAIWCLWDAHPGGWFDRKFWTASVTLILGWGLGFLLAAPHLLPLLEYAQSGSRMVHRSEGTEERPPVGLAALPQVVLPDMYGTTEKGSTFILPGYESNLTESTTAAYTGVFATLLVAPLAWCSRRHRAINVFWIFLAFFGLSWSLDVPVIVDLLRLPGLNMMSHNRLVFLTSFAILALTATGLETLLHGPIQRRWWFWLPAVLLAALCGWCAYRSIVLPEPITTQTKFDAFYQNVIHKIDLLQCKSPRTWNKFKHGSSAITPSWPCFVALDFWDGCGYGFKRPGVFVGCQCW